ncbi:MAG: hypothetical protein LUD72_04735 [Bacteroidales bacterium]|nr:hypothetical protein [Bacteroidales bacterium]
MADTYNRYEHYSEDGKCRVVPFVNIPTEGTDLIITYEKDKMRLDTISYKYYGRSDLGWLILQANPAYGSLEYAIPDMSRIRIPYPVASALSRYESAIEDYEAQNGTD